MWLALVVALLAAIVPGVSAYEAHLVTINVHLEGEWRADFAKTMRLATAEEIADSGIAFPSTPNPPTVLDPFNVPMYTCVVWMVTLDFINTTDDWIYNVVIKDHFGAELGGHPLDDMPVDLIIVSHKTGSAKKELFETQYRITWYVDRDVADPAAPVQGIAPGQTSQLKILVWTKLNPSGRQEYTSRGYYEFNSGPTAKWEDRYGVQSSAEAPSLYVTVY